MPTVKVNCTVSNCFFHKEGNICGAEKIDVEMDNYRSQNRNTEFASEFDVYAISEEASHSADTCCKTFKAKSE
ncbi:DUF1540 domain-containing protein [Rummeliibacillus pycnus]|uniref:DUF1540 domain-containing protein n=1 Tax=Rummeliibacillus pycnus TaxID=101070 RepID=UPI000C9C21AC|nr:DUF1540 domain-containing protein [Rummeliibacillus pycnus]